MQSVSARIWTRVAVSISYDDNHYTTATSIKILIDPTTSDQSGPGRSGYFLYGCLTLRRGYSQCILSVVLRVNQRMRAEITYFRTRTRNRSFCAFRGSHLYLKVLVYTIYFLRLSSSVINCHATFNHSFLISTYKKQGYQRNTTYWIKTNIYFLMVEDTN